MKTTPEQRARMCKAAEAYKEAQAAILNSSRWVDIRAAHSFQKEWTPDNCIALILDLEAASRELKGCSTAAASYSEAVALGEPFGDAMKAVLICRQSLDAAIARYTEAERELAEQRERAEVTEEAIRRWIVNTMKIASLSGDVAVGEILANILEEARAHIASRKEQDASRGKESAG